MDTFQLTFTADEKASLRIVPDRFKIDEKVVYEFSLFEIGDAFLMHLRGFTGEAGANDNVENIPLFGLDSDRPTYGKAFTSIFPYLHHDQEYKIVLVTAWSEDEKHAPQIRTRMSKL